MGFQVVFAPTAVRDLGESVAFVSQLNEEAALVIGNSLIEEALRTLGTQPYIGKRCPEYDQPIRYWLHRNYRVVYRIREDDKTVDVLRFWKCLRGDWPVGLEA